MSRTGLDFLPIFEPTFSTGNFDDMEHPMRVRIRRIFVEWTAHEDFIRQ